MSRGVAALARREKTGRGQYIDIALLDVQVACLVNQSMNCLTTGRSPRRLGNGHPNVVPYQDFPTADGDMILAIGNDTQFAKFCAVAGRPALAANRRFATNASRVAHCNVLLPVLRGITVERTTGAWIDTLEEHGVPCGPINDIDGVFADPQVIARELQLHLPHRYGAAPSVASPIRLSKTPVTYRSAPPTLGQREVLREVLDLSDERTEELNRMSVIEVPEA